jgi:Zn-dependent alcohol dehydrogenase
MTSPYKASLSPEREAGVKAIMAHIEDQAAQGTAVVPLGLADLATVIKALEAQLSRSVGNPPSDDTLSTAATLGFIKFQEAKLKDKIRDERD